MSQKTSSASRPALVVVRTKLDGTSTRHAVSRTAAPDQAALAAAVAADPALHAVRRGEIVEVTVDEEIARPVDLLALLRPVGDPAGEDETAWPDELAETYRDGDEVIEDLMREVDHVRRWVTVNGIRATGTLSTGADQQVHLVLLDDDGEGLAPLRTLAESSWYSEGMIGSAGVYTLSEVAPGLLVDRRDEDGDVEAHLTGWSESADQGVTLIAGWVRSTDQEVAAALALEPLDPGGILDEHETEVWRERVDEVALTFDLSVSAALVRAVRAALDQPGSAYALTREALGKPTGERGTVLAEVVDAWFAAEETVGAVRRWTSR